MDLAPQAFRKVIDTIVPGAETARQRVIASLASTPPRSSTVIDDLATMTGTPLLFIQQFLRELQAKGHPTLVLNMGGFSRVVEVSPALKRLLR